MEKNVLVIDDNEKIRENLRKIIRSISPEIQVFTATTVEAAYKYAAEHTIDVFLVYIILKADVPGDTSGLLFAQQIREMGKYYFSPIIFITSLEDITGVTVRNIHSFDYLEKPFDWEQAKKVVEKALQFSTKRDENRFLYVRKEGIIYSFLLEDIVYVQVSNHIMNIRLSTGSFSVPYKTCKEFLMEADSEKFIQCSRNTVINKEYIKMIDYTNMYLGFRTIDDQIEIGPRFVKRMKESIKYDKHSISIC